MFPNIRKNVHNHIMFPNISRVRMHIETYNYTYIYIYIYICILRPITIHIHPQVQIVFFLRIDQFQVPPLPSQPPHPLQWDTLGVVVCIQDIMFSRCLFGARWCHTPGRALLDTPIRISPPPPLSSPLSHWQSFIEDSVIGLWKYFYIIPVIVNKMGLLLLKNAVLDDATVLCVCGGGGLGG